MTEDGFGNSPDEIYFQVLNRRIKLTCLEPQPDLEATKEVLDKTFDDMERLYAIECNSSPSALDTNTWLLMGALNLAHRVVRLEREASLPTREKISKLLDSIPDDVFANGPAPDFDRSLPME